MQKTANWDSGQKSVGEICDHNVRPQDERKAVQKRTFTRWMNMFLQLCDPPLEVHDLFTDIKDGRVLMALLEELSGCKLLYRFRSPSHHIFRLNNISKALAFLDDRHVKLLGIDASSIADGIPSVVLNLVWNIILYFQVKEVTGGLQRRLSSSLSSLSMNSYPSSGDLSPKPNDVGNYSCFTLPSKGRQAARESKYHGKAIKTLLQWVQRCTSKFGVEVHDFGRSWRSGLAFLAMIKSINPDLVDLRESFSRHQRENIEQAFMIAHQSLQIPPLLEPEDVACASPDERSIITYVSMFLGQCPDINEDYMTNFSIREMPKFGSLDSLTFGGITAYETQAQASPNGLEKRNKQPVWRPWSRSSSGSPLSTSFQLNGSFTSDHYSSCDDVFSPCRSISEHSTGSPAFLPYNETKGSIRSTLPSPSQLDGGVASPLWRDQGFNGQKLEDFSLSSEEGIYSVSALDSDEEDAYSYILELNKEVFQPQKQLKRQVQRVEEETAEELNEEAEEEVCEMFNGSGCQQQEGSHAQNADIDLDSGVKAHSVIHRKFVLDKKESSFRDVTNTRAVSDMEPDDESCGKEPPEDEKVVRGHGNGDYSEEEMTVHVGLVTHRCDETAARLDEAEKTKLLEMSGWQKEAEEEIKKEFSLTCSPVNEKMAINDEDEMYLTFDEEKNKNLAQKEEKDKKKEEAREIQQHVQTEMFGIGVSETVDEPLYEIRFTCATRIKTEESTDKPNSKEDFTEVSEHENQEGNTSSLEFDMCVTAKTDNELKPRKRNCTDKKETTVNHPGKTNSDTDAGGNTRDGGRGWTSASETISQSIGSEGGLLQSLAAFCDITPLELEMLLVVWILLYFCLILSLTNL